ncbi:MAG TPA: formylglycine-generating enzyme family protein, partial [Pirellulaceae bacterium]|nr:formylglycine-generating enzyme family protein [Pirellulaceae bacterium]
QPPACIDIFCLAGSFIRLSTGEFPFGRSDVADTRKRRGEFHRDGLLPHEIEALEIALHPDARERKFATALDFVEALHPPPSSGVAGRGLVPSSPAGEPPSLRASFSELWRAFRNVLRALEGPPAPPSGSADDRPLVTAREPEGTPSLSREIRATMDEHAARSREATRRQSELKASLERLLAKQLATKQYVWAGGTLAALLRLAPAYEEFLRLDRFLDEIAPETGVARRCDTTGQCYSLILPGEFRMGAPLHYGRESEQPVHPVRHTRPFYMSCHPVTVSQFACCAAELPRTSAAWKTPGFIQEADHPVVNVSFDDAQVFCEFKTSLTGLKHQLPTEAQWEYACRAGLPESLERGLDTQTLARLGHFNATSTTGV